MTDPGEGGLDLLDGDRVTVLLVTKVQLHARPEEPLERELVDGWGRLPGDDRVVVPRCIDVCRAVGSHEGDDFPSRPLAVA